MNYHILLADDHGIIREVVRQYICDSELLQGPIFIEAANIDELVDSLSKFEFDLIVLDLDMPGNTPGLLIDMIKNRPSKTKILIFSGLNEQIYSIRYLKAGADGFLHKGASTREIRYALSQVITKGKYLSSGVKNLLIKESLEKNGNSNLLDKLSDREFEIARLLIRGESIKQISATLHIHITTASTYKRRIFNKLSVDNIVDLIEVFNLYGNSSMELDY